MSIVESFIVEFVVVESLIFEVLTVVAVIVEFFISELSNIIDCVKMLFSQIIEFVTSVVISFELFTCEFVEFELVRFEL